MIATTEETKKNSYPTYNWKKLMQIQIKKI